MRRHLTLRSERLAELADGELASVRGASHVVLHCLLSVALFTCLYPTFACETGRRAG